MKPIEKALKIIGGTKRGAKSRFARRLKLNQGFAWQILNDRRPVPPRTCNLIQVLTDGEVRAVELRPDVFDVSVSDTDEEAA